MIAPKTIIQLEIWYPAIDVFRLNHSMTFLPQHAYLPHLLAPLRTGGKTISQGNKFSPPRELSPRPRITRSLQQGVKRVQRH
jgi:hypothetical protein